MTAKSRHVVAALFQASTWVPPELSLTPRLAIYDDGLVIIRRGGFVDHQPYLPSYWKGVMTIEELAELAARQTVILRDPDCAGHYEFSRTSDLLTTTLVLADGQSAIAISAYGLSDGDFSSMLDSTRVTEAPSSFVAYYQFLVEILRTSRDLSPWEPDSFVALLLPAVDIKRTLPWPTAWPAWKSARVRARETSAEIVVPVSSREAFWAALPGVQVDDTISLDGRNWNVDCYPHFTDDEIWQPLLGGGDISCEILPIHWTEPVALPALPAFTVKKRRIDVEMPIPDFRPPSVEPPHR